jgi:(p)ppGpp synthase/HD superfamily hydrolase
MPETTLMTISDQALKDPRRQAEPVGQERSPVRDERSSLAGRLELGARPETLGPRLLSIRFSFALQFAAELHARQARKTTAIPYVSHLLAVSGLVLENGGDEETAIAALLHDAIEDQVDEYPGDLRVDIRDAFGERVLRVVEECSDSPTSRQKRPWKQRKLAYLAHLEQVSPEARLVSASDKLHNLRCVLADYRRIGEEVWSRFTGRREGSLWYYRELAAAFARIGPAALSRELDRVLAELTQLADSP